MKRKDSQQGIESVVLVALVLTGTFSKIKAGNYEDERPNIIFILTDDQRWDAMGYAGE